MRSQFEEISCFVYLYLDPKIVSFHKNYIDIQNCNSLFELRREGENIDFFLRVLHLYGGLEFSSKLNKTERVVSQNLFFLKIAAAKLLAKRRKWWAETVVIEDN